MSNPYRRINAVVAAIALGMNIETAAVAAPPTQIALVTTPAVSASYLKDKPISEWGWWVRSDWDLYQRKGLTQHAKNMLLQAAEHGNAQAQYVLGIILSNYENDESAFHWLGKAAAQGHTSAKFAYEYFLNDADDYGIGC